MQMASQIQRKPNRNTHQISEVSRQATLPPESRSRSGAIKALLAGLATGLQSVAALAEIWSKWGLAIHAFIFHRKPTKSFLESRFRTLTRLSFGRFERSRWKPDSLPQRSLCACKSPDSNDQEKYPRDRNQKTVGH